MAKIIYEEFSPEDPIFSEGPMTYSEGLVPASVLLKRILRDKQAGRLDGNSAFGRGYPELKPEPKK